MVAEDAAGDAFLAALTDLQVDRSLGPGEKVMRLWDQFPVETDWLLRDWRDDTGMLFDGASIPAAVSRLVEALGRVSPLVVW